MAGVSGHIAALVCGVDGQVQTHQLLDFMRVEAQLFAEITSPVTAAVKFRQDTILVNVAENAGSHNRQLGQQIHAVFVHVIPVLGLVDALGIGLGVGGLRLHDGDSGRELCHGVKGLGERVDHAFHMAGDFRTGNPLS
eukprot:Lithocolla_globosa_v1_NODE_4430_length_1436_cov_629.953657.p2 type:complete len:138 gc:universal NODE_4430_length_1436_cov_629.953657:583-996(+)